MPVLIVLKSKRSSNAFCLEVVYKDIKAMNDQMGNVGRNPENKAALGAIISKAIISNAPEVDDTAIVFSVNTAWNGGDSCL
jgi:hypothetical protein